MSPFLSVVRLHSWRGCWSIALKWRRVDPAIGSTELFRRTGAGSQACSSSPCCWCFTQRDSVAVGGIPRTVSCSPTRTSTGTARRPPRRDHAIAVGRRPTGQSACRCVGGRPPPHRHAATGRMARLPGPPSAQRHDLPALVGKVGRPIVHQPPPLEQVRPRVGRVPRRETVLRANRTAVGASPEVGKRSRPRSCYGQTYGVCFRMVSDRAQPAAEGRPNVALHRGCHSGSSRRCPWFARHRAGRILRVAQDDGRRSARRLRH